MRLPYYPGSLLRQVLEGNVSDNVDPAAVRRLAQLSELLGFDIHVQTDYGDEMGGRTPWELFGEPDARQAFAMAEEAVGLAQEIINNVTS